MKRVAPTKPPVVIPVIVVPIDVHITLIVPMVEGGDFVKGAIRITAR